MTSAAEMILEYHAATADRWTDLERLFESRGGPHHCWCMFWRETEFKHSLPGKAGRKASLKKRVDPCIPVGLLGYLDGEPVAWCSIAPRETYRPLGGDENITGVWSLVCFFISRDFQGQGHQRAADPGGGGLCPG